MTLARDVGDGHGSISLWRGLIRGEGRNWANRLVGRCFFVCFGLCRSFGFLCLRNLGVLGFLRKFCGNARLLGCFGLSSGFGLFGGLGTLNQVER